MVRRKSLSSDLIFSFTWKAFSFRKMQVLRSTWEVVEKNKHAIKHYRITFSTQFAYISGCVLRLTSKNLWTVTGNYSHYMYILLIKDSKTAGISFYKGTRLDRKYFFPKFYFGFIGALNKTRSSLLCHATWFCLYTVLVLSQTMLW